MSCDPPPSLWHARGAARSPSGRFVAQAVVVEGVKEAVDWILEQEKELQGKAAKRQKK